MVNPDSDLEAVDAVIGGDAEAFRAIVERWQGPLVNLAYRYCNDRFRAEDLAQEAFLRAYRNLRSWRREAAFSTWLFALAANVYRTELKRLPPAADSIVDVTPVERGAGPAGELAERERSAAVRGALASLPAEYRDPLTNYYFLDQDVATAASVLGMPEGTFKSRLARGRAILREKLAKWQGVRA